MTIEATAQIAQRIGELLVFLRQITHATQLGRDFVDLAGSELELINGLMEACAICSSSDLASRIASLSVNIACSLSGGALCAVFRGPRFYGRPK
jgi:hypothetical protein